MAIHIVLVEPEIPPNTGNIARTAAATDSVLHLVKPLGFSLDEKSLRRAGLDYWDKVDLEVYVDLEDFFLRNPELSGVGSPDRRPGADPRLWFATTKARRVYTDVRYGPGDYIMFGKESAGIPEEILKQHEEQCVRIPMWGSIRSLNLANSAAIVLYEALRQNDFFDLERTGELHRLKW